MRRLVALALVAALWALAASGCGGSTSGSVTEGLSQPNSRRETATEATWRHSVEQFVRNLDTDLQNLTAAASADAYAAVANLGPLVYCQQNLDALGPPLPVYQFAYGSFQAACDELSLGARLWQAEVRENGESFYSSVLAIRRGSRFLQRGEQRLSTYVTKKPPLQGEEAEQVQAWARQIDRYWPADIDGAFAAVDKKLGNSVADPIKALWDEHSGGDALRVTDCHSDIARYAKSPPDALARGVLAQLQASCRALESATSPSFSKRGYESAKRQVRATIAELEKLSP